ncbi:FMN-dependent dehydrogenase [Aspergillus bertholletiae]|uniref:FMN-dependent dehydrogenase n=1 Tax=Aspergillus bertholletiae TaxID=1226010 RepID=A0A5N7BJ70_9EURO|nr:FMN-dependent dehydrogenase [Aspergillus bertholletiae]
MPDPITLREVESIAKDKLPRHVYEFYASGSDAQNALVRNEKAFHRLCIRPRVLIDVSEIDTTAEILGYRASLPIGIAPSAMQRLAGGGGELDVSRAAGRMGLNLTLSSQSTTSLEEVARTRKEHCQDSLTAPPFWMQIYLYEDIQKSVDLIRRAEAAGYQALVVTVDTPVLGNRLTERRMPVVLPQGMELPNVQRAQSTTARQPSVNRLLMNARTAAEAKALRDAVGNIMHSSSLTWAPTMTFLRSVTHMKIILKGIMTGEDAALAVQHGADAIIVSNHGGRQLDATCATIEALPEVVAIVQKRCPVILDGGIRSGADVFKALALGADFVLVGRPALWGLAYNGQEGVETTMHILERELSRTMALAGAKCLEDITKDKLAVVARDRFGIAKL